MASTVVKPRGRRLVYERLENRNLLTSSALTLLAAGGVGTGAPKTATTTTVSVASPVISGSSVNLTAVVTANTGSATPAGTVTFEVDGTILVPSETLVNGDAAFTLSTTGLKIGPHTITALYGGNTTFSASSASPGATMTVIASASSNNWSGFAAETNLSNPQTNSVTAVSGSWKVPAVTGPSSGTTYSAVWVGIDGYGNGNGTVEQIGTDENVVNGTAVYYAWYEMDWHGVTGCQQRIATSDQHGAMKISAGDSITASVTYLTSGPNKGQFQLIITDATQQNESFTTYQSLNTVGTTLLPAQRSSAEWIVETPEKGAWPSLFIQPLATFAPVTFTNASVTINGTSGPIDGAAWQACQISMASGATLEATDSAFADSAGTSSFKVGYLRWVSGAAVAATQTQQGSIAPKDNLLILSAAMAALHSQTPLNSQDVFCAQDDVFASLDSF